MREDAEISILALSPALRDDYLAFFDHYAFVDNPRWAFCYCYFNHCPHTSVKWRDRRADQNRSAVSDLIDRAEMRGYLAYAGERPIGWCNADLHAVYTTLDETKPDRAQIGAIVCFIVAKPYRRMGVARRLLDAACAGFRDLGIEIVEGYARNDTGEEAANYHRPLSMYLGAGFQPVGQNGQVVVLRKSLRP